MQIEPVVIGDQGTEWTDNPRPLTADEAAKVRLCPYIEAVKMHRQLTNSTLGAATRAVKALSREH